MCLLCGAASWHVQLARKAAADEAERQDAMRRAETALAAAHPEETRVRFWGPPPSPFRTQSTLRI